MVAPPASPGAHLVVPGRPRHTCGSETGQGPLSGEHGVHCSELRVLAVVGRRDGEAVGAADRDLDAVGGSVVTGAGDDRRLPACWDRLVVDLDPSASSTDLYTHGHPRRAADRCCPDGAEPDRQGAFGRGQIDAGAGDVSVHVNGTQGNPGEVGLELADIAADLDVPRDRTVDDDGARSPTGGRRGQRVGELDGPAAAPGTGARQMQRAV